jgi:hypothetical protein
MAQGVHGNPPWDYSWLDDLGNEFQRENCDLSVIFAWDNYDHLENLESLLANRYC